MTTRDETTQDPDLAGVDAWAMVPTPFTRDGADVDTDSLARFARHAADQGCTGLIALGVIAEPTTLTVGEKRTCLETLAAVTPALPVVATVMTLDTCAAVAEALTLTRDLDTPVAGLMVPVAHADPAAFRDHLVAIHAATELPLRVQDLPRATGVTIAIDDLITAIDGLDDVVAGVKCESPPTFVRIARLRERTDVTCISGFGGIGLVDDVVSGATSVAVGVTPISAVAGALHAARRGQHADASRLIGRHAPLIHLETQPGQSIAIRKEHWRRAGVIAYRTTREPTPVWTQDLEPHSAAHEVLLGD